MSNCYNGYMVNNNINRPFSVCFVSNFDLFKAFKLFDDDESGKITFGNLQRVANELGENLTDEELQVGNYCYVQEVFFI